jgi:Squalene-hopene cyclase C-terminal domain/Prenyltransferase and squalene oxidase repeat
VRLLSGLLASLVLASPAQLAPVERAESYLAARQQSDAAFAEPEGNSDVTLTAWSVLGLRAAGRMPASLERDGVSPTGYLAGTPIRSVSDLALRIVALDALGGDTSGLADRLAGERRADGRIGPLVNSTVWAVIALRAVERPVPRATIGYLLRQQHRNGGWPWARRGAPDSNDTAAAIQALRAAGVGGKPVRRGLAYLRRAQNRDGGFALTPGRSSDAQSTAWAIQAFVAAGARPPGKAVRYLLALQQPAGSFRYSRTRAITPAWVTASVLPALARKPFPLR